MIFSPHRIDFFSKKVYTSKAMKHDQVKNRRILLLFDRDGASERLLAAGAMRYAASKSNWDVVLLNLERRDFNRQIASLSDRNRFDGMVCGLQITRRGDIPESQRPRVCVFAVADEREPSPFKCVVDDASIATAAAELLLRRGYTSFVYVGAKSHDFERRHSEDRQRAFAARVRKAGFPVKAVFADSNLAATLSALPKPIGLMAYNDIIASMVYSACRQAKLEVPGQVAICGVDDDESICENLTPTLTSIRPDFEAGGYAAAKLLDRALESRCKGLKTRYGVQSVTERSSTLALRTGARIVAAAREIIQARSADSLSVADIASELNVSASTLHLRFAEITGHTPHAEIEHFRLEHACNLLGQSDSPIKVVAQTCGFPTTEHFQRLFKKRFGLTPGKWRKARKAISR